MNTKALALAAVLISGLAVSAKAQQTANFGDLVLGFVPNGSLSSGTTTNVEIDLGNAASFLTAGPGTYSIGNLGTDLSSTYGSGWASSTLSFGVVGGVSTSSQVTGAPAKAVWASQTEASGTYPANSLLTGSNTTTISHVGGMYSGLTGSFGGSGTTVLSDLSSQTDAVNGINLQGFTVGNSVGGSWSVEQGSNAFVAPNATTGFLTVVDSGNSSDLLEMTNGAGSSSVDLGYFTLASNGALTFTVIPEPSTYAAILGAISIGFAMVRRRNRVSSLI
jgi:hypothetical protein